jgi:MFS family permease
MGQESVDPSRLEDTTGDPSWPIDSLSLPHEIAFVLVVSLCQLLTQSALGMSIAPLHIIGRHFGIDNDPGLMSWSPAAYSLTVGTFILVAGRIGDLYGHRRAVLDGWMWFALCGVVAGRLCTTIN